MKPSPKRQDGGRKCDAEKAPNDIVVTGSLIRCPSRSGICREPGLHSMGRRTSCSPGGVRFSEYMLTIPQNFAGDLSDFGTSAASNGTTLGAGTTYNQ